MNSYLVITVICLTVATTGLVGTLIFRIIRNMRSAYAAMLLSIISASAIGFLVAIVHGMNGDILRLLGGVVWGVIWLTFVPFYLRKMAE